MLTVRASLGLNGALLASLVLFSSGLAGHTELQAQQPYRISVNVDLVVLQVTVHDRKDRCVSGLREEDFEVYEDGARQAIRVFRHDDVPVTVGLVVDHSGSMRPRLASVVAAAQTFVHSSNPEDQLFVVNFNENVTLGLPEAIRFTNRSDDLARAIANVPATGKTALYDALMQAHEQLRAGAREKKVLIVISDGGDNASTHSLDEVLKVAARSSTMVYTIGVFDEEDPDRNPDVLRRLATATGGEAIFPSQLLDVVTACERIARDIRNQYTIGYISGNTAHSGSYRAVQVVARDAAKRKLLVRTRSGYIAGREESPVKAGDTK